MEEFIKEWLFDPVIGKLIASILGVVLTIVVVRFIQRSVSKRIKDTSNRYRVRKFVAFIGYFVALLVLVIVFSDKLGGLTVALGIAGAGIAFALQEVIASVAGWFAISFANFYKTGDRVQVGGIKGDVIDVGIIRSTIMEVGQWVKGDLYNGRVVRLANSFVFKEPVFNYSSEFPFLWDEITIPVKYGSNFKKAEQILTRILDEIVGEYTNYAKKAWAELVNKFLLEDAQVEPMVTLEVDENWMTFILRYVVDYKKRRSTKNKIYFSILEEFENTGGEVSIASSAFDIKLLQDDALKVNIKNHS